MNVASVNMTTNNVQVFTDPNNAQLRDVTVTASAVVNTMFMQWLGVNNVTVTAVGNGLAPDRGRDDGARPLRFDGNFLSGSGQLRQACLWASSPRGATISGRFPSAIIITFTARRPEFRDRARLCERFRQRHRIARPHRQCQRSVNNCSGGTGTPGAISIAYNELYKMALPGALNVLLVETDGLPNTMLMNFWDSTNNVSAISSGSNCTDAQGKKKSGRRFRQLVRRTHLEHDAHRLERHRDLRQLLLDDPEGHGHATLRSRSLSRHVFSSPCCSPT